MKTPRASIACFALMLAGALSLTVAADDKGTRTRVAVTLEATTFAPEESAAWFDNTPDPIGYPGSFTHALATGDTENLLGTEYTSFNRLAARNRLPATAGFRG